MSIDEKIASAFTTTSKSDVVAALIKEAEVALADSAKAANDARVRALDPTLTNDQIREARKNMDDAAFARDRLQAALPRLNERLKELKDSELNANRLASYKKLEIERDEIVEELKEYPALAKRLAAIVERLAKNDAAIDNLNNYALPNRTAKLRSAELIARGLQSFSPQQFVTIPRIGQETKLVRFEHDKSDPYLLPRPIPFVGYSPPKPERPQPAKEHANGPQISPI